MLAFCVDAGGTHCRARLFSSDGRVLAEGASGPCNPTTDLARAAASLNDAWAQCAAAAGQDPASVSCAIGGAGMVVTSIQQAFLAEIPRFGRITVANDGYAALIGATGGQPGALIIAGTGVVGQRLYADGLSLQRDGWGWIGGDRGSGAWIGRRALRHALAAMDGLVAADALSDAVLDALGARDRRANAWLSGLGPDRLGALVPLVFDTPCATAEATLRRAAEHLAGLAGTLDCGPEIPLFVAGSVATRLRGRIADVLGREVGVPPADAITGCFLLATGAAPPERMVERH